VLVSYFRELNLPNLIVVSPDAGGVERARFFAQKVGAPLAIVDKRRTDLNVAEVMNVVGDVKARAASSSTTSSTPPHAGENGGRSLRRRRGQRYAAASHAVLSGPAIDRIASSRLEQVVVTNTIPLREAAQKLPRLKCFPSPACWARPSRAFTWKPA